MEGKAVCWITAVIIISSSFPPVPFHSVQKQIKLFLVFLKELLISEASTDADEYLKLDWATHGLFPSAVSTQPGIALGW